MKHKIEAKNPETNQSAECGHHPSTGSTLSAKWTMNDLLQLIPGEWRDVKVSVGDNINRAHQIKRVALHVNRNGSRVIVLHDNELQQVIENA